MAVIGKKCNNSDEVCEGERGEGRVYELKAILLLFQSQRWQSSPLLIQLKACLPPSPPPSPPLTPPPALRGLSHGLRCDGPHQALITPLTPPSTLITTNQVHTPLTPPSTPITTHQVHTPHPEPTVSAASTLLRGQ